VGACPIGSGRGRESPEHHSRICILPLHSATRFLQMDIPTKYAQQIQHAGSRLHTLDRFGPFADAH